MSSTAVQHKIISDPTELIENILMRFPDGMTIAQLDTQLRNEAEKQRIQILLGEYESLVDCLQQMRYEKKVVRNGVRFFHFSHAGTLLVKRRLPSGVIAVLERSMA